MKALFIDPVGGIAGDMLLAALCGLGFDPAPLERAFRRAGLDVGVRAAPRCVGGLAGHALELALPDAQPLRHLADLTAILSRLEAPAAARERAIDALGRLAQVEAAVHGMPVERVHFHEVGALDTLVDVLGAFWAVEALGVEHVVCAPLPWFGGTIRCAHGPLPLPAPAVLRLLDGKPVYPTAVRQEIITPTGALLVDRLARRFAAGPRGVVAASAVGYGAAVVEGAVNGVRVTLYEAAEGETP